MALLYIAMIATRIAMSAAVQPAPAPPPVPAAAEATPVLDEYRRIDAAIADRTVVGLVLVEPTAPGLVFDKEATPEQQTEALAALLAMQDVIAQAIALSKRTPEPYQSSAAPDEWDPSPVWLMSRPGRFGILRADAGRCFDAGAFDDAAARIAAAIRFTTRSAMLEEPMFSRMGTDSLIPKLNAMLDSGAVFSPRAVADLEDAFLLRESEWKTLASRWEAFTRRNLRECRELAAADDGVAQIHERLRAAARPDESIDQLRLLSSPLAGLLIPSIVRTRDAQPSAASIAAALDRAEAIIPRMRAAMEDRKTGDIGLERINDEMSADETQIARLVLGPFAAVQHSVWSEMSQAAIVRARLARMVEEPTHGH